MNKRRFIAGAICPRCSRLDTIFVYQNEGITIRACSDCEFEEAADVVLPQKELPTRVNQTVDKTLVEVQPIKIIDPPKS